MDTRTAISHTRKAAGAVFDVLVDHMDDMYLLVRRFFHSFQKSAGHVHGIAVLPFGAPVKNKNLHLSSTSSGISLFSFFRYTFAEQEKLTAAAKQITPKIKLSLAIWNVAPTNIRSAASS